MSVGEVFLESVSTGVITTEEIAWITSGQGDFNRQEEAMVLKLGRLLDDGVIQIGCRLRRQAAISHYEATHDPLTDLLNRRPFLAELDKARREADSDLAEHVLVAIDLDHFKPVNDQAGHAAGDRLLKDIAQLMRRELREGDIVARLGGDEFAVILRLCPLSTGVRIARALLKSIERYQLTWQHQHFRVTASLGVVGLNAGNRSLPSSEALMQQVDRALYNAKQEGRNTVMVVQSDGTIL